MTAPSLQIEYIKAMSQGTNLTVIYGKRYSLLTWATRITSMDSPPLVHSVSYGNDEKQQVAPQRRLEPGPLAQSRA